MNKVVIFCGAGASVASGIPSYRDDENGIWNIADMKQICVKGKELDRVSIEFYDQFARMMTKTQPSIVHRSFAKWQEKYGSDRIRIYTQNIDDLFERAGCQDVIHVHGRSGYAKCVRCNDTSTFDKSKGLGCNASCKMCGGKMRHDIVYYGEKGYYNNMLETVLDMNDNDMFILAGTSGKAIDMNMFIKSLDFQKLYWNMSAEDDIDYDRYNVIILNKMENSLDDVEQIISSVLT